MKKLLIVADSAFDRKDRVIRFLTEIVPILKRHFEIKIISTESKTKELLELLSHGYLEIIQGLGHSAKNEEQETILVKNTLDALCN